MKNYTISLNNGINGTDYSAFQIFNQKGDVVAIARTTIDELKLLELEEIYNEINIEDLLEAIKDRFPGIDISNYKYICKHILFDAHIHVGQFREIYETPAELVAYLTGVGVGKFAVSSTTICEDDYDKVIREIKELVALAPERVFPVLWLTPLSLHNGGKDKLLDSGIVWKCVKIHPWLSPGGWREDNDDREIAISVARDLRIPLLIHTGETKGSYPLCFERSIAKHQDVTFILAHGRPINEAIELMQKYENAWVDTAFMPIENIAKLCDEKLSDRVLWGSDYPITKYYYPKTDLKAYYLDLIQKLKDSVSQDDFELITHKNFEKLFG